MTLIWVIFPAKLIYCVKKKEKKKKLFLLKLICLHGLESVVQMNSAAPL